MNPHRIAAIQTSMIKCAVDDDFTSTVAKESQAIVPLTMNGRDGGYDLQTTSVQKCISELIKK